MNIEKINFTIDSNDFNALKIKIFFVADPCHHYSNLSEANRNTNHQTPQPGPTFCDSQLPKGWYRFLGMQEQKCKQHLCQETDVVQSSPGG